MLGVNVAEVRFKEYVSVWMLSPSSGGCCLVVVQFECECVNKKLKMETAGAASL